MASPKISMDDAYRACVIIIAIIVHSIQRCDIGSLLIRASSNLLVRLYPARGLTRLLTSVIVVGATGLCDTTVWSQSQGGYATVAIGGKQIYKTQVVDSGKEPEWNDTLQL